MQKMIKMTPWLFVQLFLLNLVVGRNDLEWNISTYDCYIVNSDYDEYGFQKDDIPFTLLLASVLCAKP